MDENNNLNTENGFVLQDNPAEENQIEENRVEPSPAPETEPLPMPSGDNLYRFQNTMPKEPKKKKEKNGPSMSKVVLSAVVFGVVAAACFFFVTTLFDRFSGSNGQIQEVNPSQNSMAVTTVTGSAATTADVSGIVEKVMPSIVAITERSTQTSYFGRTYSSEGAGSGFIVKQDDDQLLIVTNNHVVAGAEKISVQFNDEESADAVVKGTSESNDLAVITVPLSSLKDSTKKSIRVASLGSSDDAKVGQMVIAIGNALGYGQSVTVGYVSAKNREISSSDSSTGKSTTQVLMQTDAAINPGNSGGALIDTNGNVIGINSSKYFSYNSTNVEGMGYAIPMSDAISVINSLMNRKVLKDNEKGYLGITGRPISESVSESYGIPVGVYVAAVSDTGAAYKAGIKRGDVITKINGQTVKTIEQVQEIVNNTKVGTTIKVILQRSDDGSYKEKEIDVVLKGKDTLDGLESDSKEDEYEPEEDSQVFPWGGSIY
ncbi:MAG: trypsin-like peptidase domain-containing protein [Lachnospiraceae bacterium]|nr:trypsin-like peptidase domain-containing protein [Lachnospiraceae bacterium]